MMKLDSKKICLAGKNEIAVGALLHMVKHGWKNRLIVCPNRTDSGTSNWQPSLIRFANAFNVEVVTLETAQKIEDLIFISLEYDLIIKPSTFRTDRLYNIHFSRLPAYKGMYTSALPILHGAAHSGVTLHKIDAGIDTGAIIAQISFDLPATWTARDLYFAYMDYGLRLFCDYFEKITANKPPESTPQSAKGSTYFSKSSINYNKITIDLKNTAEGIISQLRAFSFREYQTPVVKGLDVGGWEILPEISREKPGTVLEQDSECITLSTIDYKLRLTRSCVWDWFTLTADDSSYRMDTSLINVKDKNGWTPLIKAAYAGNTALCRLLLNAGADPNCTNSNGTTPLMYALSGKKPEEVVKVLLEYHADPEQIDFFGNDLKSYHPLSAIKLGL